MSRKRRRKKQKKGEKRKKKKEKKKKKDTKTGGNFFITSTLPSSERLIWQCFVSEPIAKDAVNCWSFFKARMVLPLELFPEPVLPTSSRRTFVSGWKRKNKLCPDLREVASSKYGCSWPKGTEDWKSQ